MLTNQATGPDVFREVVLRTFSGPRGLCPGKHSASGGDGGVSGHKTPKQQARSSD